MNDISVGIVVVTYKRLKCLERCIEKLTKQSYTNVRIYLIDNHSNDGTKQFCRNLSIDNFSYYELDDNLGGSYGFAYGIQQAICENNDLIWGMDDDAYPEIDACEKIVKAYEKYGDNIVYWSNSILYSRKRKEKYDEVKGWTFVGFALSKKMIEKIGLPRNDLFIFYDDLEYAKRIRKSGGKIMLVDDSVIVHEGFINKHSLEKFGRRKFLGKEIKVQKLPAWKYYYMIRNNIVIADEGIERAKAICFSLKATLITGYVYPEIRGVCIRAFKDGMHGITGKVISP